LSEERKSAYTAIIEALEQVEDMDDVLVLFTRKDGKVHRIDNDITIGDALFLIEVFKFVLLSSGMPR